MAIPSSCDVLIVGAGPAGAAAARALSRLGRDVVLVDQRSFPRDKVCGDGLISDALGALRTLGLPDRVGAEVVNAHELWVYVPSGLHVPLKGRFACVPRERFDAILLDGAIESGARFFPGVTALRAIESNGRVPGAHVRTADGEVDIHAAMTLLDVDLPIGR